MASKPRLVEFPLGQGATIAEAVRRIGVTRDTVCRWRKLLGGMQHSRLARLREPEEENRRLRPAVSDLRLDGRILTGAAREV